MKCYTNLDKMSWNYEYTREKLQRLEYNPTDSYANYILMQKRRYQTDQQLCYLRSHLLQKTVREIGNE